LQHFTRMASARFDRPLPTWTPEQLRRWMQADWPGNVRELRNFADRLVLGIAEDTDNEAASIDENVESPNAASLSARVNAFERQLIDEALKQNQGIVAKAAEALHLPKKTLYDKLRRHRIEPARE
jgi:two-component system, NtrC family, C4-dicarboxylate transport response regulator DctD